MERFTRTECCRVVKVLQLDVVKDIDCVPVLLKKKLDQIQFPRSGRGPI